LFDIRSLGDEEVGISEDEACDFGPYILVYCDIASGRDSC